MGSRVVMDAVTWKVIELQGVRLTLSGDGRHRCVDVSALAERDDIVIDGRSLRSSLREVEFVQLDRAQQAAFERLRADRNEWKTGYRSGSVLAAAAGEPRAPNPKRRVELIAAERRVAVGTMYRKFRELETQGPGTVLDRRRERGPEADPGFDAQFLAIAERMLTENRDRSTIKSHSFWIDVCAEVRNVHDGGDPVPEPSLERFRTWLGRKPKSAHHFGKATTRRNTADAADADRHLGGLVATRPGEVVIIDSNRLDVLGVDPVTGTVLIMVWTLAWDLYSAWPLALRITAGDPTDVDLALLLSDIVRPRPQGAAGRCRFWGVPDQLIVRIGEDWGVGPAAYAPMLIPQAILVDGAKAALGKLVRKAAEPLGCDIMEAHPRTGSDKAALERNFGSMGTMYLQHFPGYKASSVTDRGRAPQADALLTPEEHEDAWWHWVELAWQKRPHPGLRDPAFMQRRLTPEERYEMGIARAGFHHLPADPKLWLRLLPAKLLKVERSGIRHEELTFDSEKLDPYRRDSDLPGAGGDWRVRVDRRDLLHVWLEDHENDKFIRVPWRHLRAGDPLFGDRALHYLKRRLTDQRSTALVRHGKEHELDEVMIEFVRMVRAGDITLAGAERVMKKALAEGRAAQRDATRAGSEAEPEPEAADNSSPASDDGAPEAESVSSEQDESPSEAAESEDDVTDVDMRDDGPAAELAAEDDAATWLEPQDDGPTYRWM